MNREFTAFTVETASKAQSASKGEHLAMQAIVTTYNSDNQVLDKVEMPLITVNYLRQLLETGQSISLNGCYIENFGAHIFNNEDSSQIYPVQNLQMTDCFINANQIIDLRTLQFTGVLKFSHSVFAVPVDFSGSKFDTEWCDFDYVYFLDGNVSFSGCQFTTGHKSFKNVIWGVGKKDFQYADFGDGLLSFINTQWGAGDVIFSDCRLGYGKTTFKVAQFGKGRIDFSHTNFGSDDLTFEKTQFGDGNFNFRNATVGTGKIEFTSAEFGKGSKNFVSTDFGSGDLSFKNANFGSGKISFKHCKIGTGKKDFHFAKIKEGDVIIERVQFSTGLVDFRAVDFGSGKVQFNRCEFSYGDVIFEACELSGNYLQISNSIFNAANLNLESINFVDSQLLLIKNEFIQGKISTHKARLNQLVVNNCQIDNYADLRVDSCRMLDLSESIIRGIVDIQPYNFDSQIDNINLSGVRLIGRIYLDWEKSNIKASIARQDTSMRNKAEQYRILKENYNAIGQYEDEDNAYVEFKRFEAKAILQENLSGNTFSNLWHYFTHGFKWLIFDKVGLYATNPVRVLLSMAVTYLLFSVLYIVLPWVTDTAIISSLFEPDDTRNLSHVGKAFYHSAITFLTIGYGDYYPSGIDRWLSGIEGFIGLFLMSYFTVAFVRKILR